MATTLTIPGSPPRHRRNNSTDSISLSIDCPLDQLSFSIDPRELSEVQIKIDIAEGLERKETEFNRVKAQSGELELVLEGDERVGAFETSDEGLQVREKFTSPPFSCEENAKLYGPYPAQQASFLSEQEVKEVAIEIPHAQLAALASAAAAIAIKQVDIAVYEGRLPIVKYPSAEFSCAENAKLPGPYTIWFSCEENAQLPGPYPSQQASFLIEDEVKEVGIDVPYAQLAALSSAAAAVAIKQVEINVYEGRLPIVKYPSAEFSCATNSKLRGPYPTQPEEVKVDVPYAQLAALASAAASVALNQVEIDVYEGRLPIVKYPSAEFSCAENAKLPGPYTIWFSCEENAKLPGPYPMTNGTDDTNEVEFEDPLAQIAEMASFAANAAARRVKVNTYEGTFQESKEISFEVPYAQIAAIASFAAAMAAQKVEVEEYEGRLPIVKYPSGEFSCEECAKLPGPYPTLQASHSSKVPLFEVPLAQIASIASFAAAQASKRNERLIESKEMAGEIRFAQISAIASAAAAVAAKQVEVEVYKGRSLIIKYPSGEFSCEDNAKLAGPYPQMDQEGVSKMLDDEVKFSGPPFSCKENAKLPGPYPIEQEGFSFTDAPMVVEVVHSSDEYDGFGDHLSTAVSEGPQVLAAEDIIELKKDEPGEVTPKVQSQAVSSPKGLTSSVTTSPLKKDEIKSAELDNKEMVAEEEEFNNSWFSRLGKSKRNVRASSARKVSSPAALSQSPKPSTDSPAPPAPLERKGSFFGVTKDGKPRKFRPVKNIKKMMSGKSA